MQLTPEQIREYGPDALQKVRAELAKRSLLEFTRQAWPILHPGTPMVDGWVLHAICEHLEACESGKIKRLLINVPPGSMKSILTRVMFPLWVWTKKPYTRFVGASYALQLAERDNYYARTILMNEWYEKQFGVSISAEQGAKVNFDNTSMGGIRAISVGGATTGYRGDYLIVDDPHNVQKGESDAERSDAVTWFREAAQNRVNDIRNSVRIVIMQRVHEEDVSSAALEMGYEHLCVPMRWEERQRKTTSIGWTDPRTEENQLMWPERFPDPELKEMERNMGEYATAAQNQQTPVPRKGGLINVDAIKVIDDLPDEPFIAVRAWDLAASEGAGAFTVGLQMLYGQESDKFYIADVRRKQLSAGGVRQLITDTAEEDGVPTKIVLPQDPGQAGKALVEDMIAALTGFNAKAELQSGSKETRAAPLATQVDIGRVCALNRTWTRPMLDEMRFFPKGKFKDQVDAAASAFNELAALTRKKERKKPTLTVVGERQENWAKVV